VDDDAFNVFSLQSILSEVFGLQSEFEYSGADALKTITNRDIVNLQ
jgi:CheY-like chemotaxis protein